MVEASKDTSFMEFDHITMDETRDIQRNVYDSRDEEDELFGQDGFIDLDDSAMSLGSTQVGGHLNNGSGQPN